MSQKWLLHRDIATRNPESVLASLMSRTVEFAETGLFTINLRYLMEIENWCNRGRDYIFIESLELLAKIYNAKITAVQPENVYALRNPVSIIVPQNPLNIPGIFVAPFNRQRNNALAKRMQIIRGKFNVANTSHITTPGGFLAYKRNLDEDSRLCQADWNSYLSDDLGRVDCENSPLLNSDYTTCAFATKLMVYLAAFPESMRGGYPDVIRKPKKNGLFNGRDAAVRTISFPTGYDPRAAHWRSWHFRELRHERFKRNPDGSARIVLVKDAFVNTPGQPYTVKDLSQIMSTAA